MAEFPDIVELNVGGVFYTTALTTLTKVDESLLARMFSGSAKVPAVKDAKGRYFLDRDGVLFRYILDFLRNQKLVLPENFHEKDRLRTEAEYFQLPAMVLSLATLIQTSSTVATIPTSHKFLNSSGEAGADGGGGSGGDGLLVTPNSGSSSPCGGTGSASGIVDVVPSGSREGGYITVGYRGTFAFGRDGLADVKFRKLSRLLVCGRVALCREAFGDTLNESRDPDRGTSDRYTQRYFLKHSYLEQAFDMLQCAGFRLVGCCGSGTNSAGEIKPGMDSEENKWHRYNEFVFCR